MSQIARKWIQNRAIDGNKLDSDSSYIINGLYNYGTLIQNQDATFNGDIIVHGAVVHEGDSTSSGALTVDSIFTAQSKSVFNGDVEINGHTYFDSSAHFNVEAYAERNFYAHRDLIVSRDTTVGGSLLVAGDNYTIASNQIDPYCTGWVIAGLSKSIWIKKVGRSVYVRYKVSGQSNSTEASFPLPYICRQTPVEFTCRVKDNGVFLPCGIGIMAVNQSDAYFYKDSAASLWTASGVKEISGQFFYESD